MGEISNTALFIGVLIKLLQEYKQYKTDDLSINLHQSPNPLFASQLLANAYKAYLGQLFSSLV